mgnify:CR=1 FL=1
MSDIANDLIVSLGEAVAHAKKEGDAIIHEPIAPRQVRKLAKLTQAQMAPLMGMSLSGYRKYTSVQKNLMQKILNGISQNFFLRKTLIYIKGMIQE